MHGTSVALARANATGEPHESQLPANSRLVTKIQNDFLDIPGLTLTLSQARKRVGTDERTCEAILGALVDANVLARTPGNSYVRFFPRGSDRPRCVA